MKALRILIADDHEVVRQGIRALLGGRSEWEIAGEAATGREAVEKTSKLRPDLVLLDLTMPDLDGLQAIPLILAASPGVKILVLTMHDCGEMVAKVLAAGATGLVLKSDAARALVLAIRTMGKDEPFLSPAVTQKVLAQLVKTGAAEPSPSVLTARELQVLKLVARGRSTKEIAAALGISVKTAAAHRSNIMHRLNLGSYGDLIHYTIRHKIEDTFEA